MSTSDFSPSHRALPRIFANPKESQPAEITQLLFQSGSKPCSRDRACKGLWKVLGHTGAIAFSRTGNPATGDFRDATVLRKFGDVPDDLSAL
jgi:hypothetical protein